MLKSVFDRVLRGLQKGGLTVTYWDGACVTYGPDQPYCEITIKQPRVLRAMLRDITLGFGEAYMKGEIELTGEITGPARLLAENIQLFKALNRFAPRRPRHRNIRSKQRGQIAHHYDLGNDFFELWLDDSLTYSCAYFHSGSDSLEQAQEQKVDYLLRKLQLQPGQALLDIGCGWGKLLITAAQRYSVNCYGITLSEEQHRMARDRVSAAGVADLITIDLLNYQDLQQVDLAFDRIVSVGMFEHVGRGNLAGYFEIVHRHLKPSGLSVLHTITDPRGEPGTAFADRYIFPGGYLPTVPETLKHMERQGFELLDYENLRTHYALTLDEWLRRFDEHKTEVIRMYGPEFYRMWRLYLGSSVSGFRYGPQALSQFTFARRALPGLPLTRDHLYS